MNFNNPFSNHSFRNQAQPGYPFQQQQQLFRDNMHNFGQNSARQQNDRYGGLYGNNSNPFRQFQDQAEDFCNPFRQFQAQGQNQSDQKSRGQPSMKSQQAKNQKKEAPKTEKIKVEENTNSGNYYKNIGNQYYLKGLYPQALENYTRAIEENNTESAYFSNRARCHKQLGNLNKAYEDVKVAMELDDKNIKAYVLCAQILAELGKIEQGMDKLNKALSRVKKAMELCDKEGKSEFKKDIEQNMKKIQKVIWLKGQETRKQKRVETMNFIKALVYRNNELGNDEKGQIYKEVSNLVGDCLKPTIDDVPDFLCCKVTMDLMINPVITPSGVTYDKDTLTEHIKNGGQFDPITREPLKLEQIHVNKTIKKAAEDFIKGNPWVYEQQVNESFMDIKF